MTLRRLKGSITMTYTVDKPLSQFEFWSGAKYCAKALTIEQLDQLDDLLPEVLGENPSETAINDLFWFEDDYVARLLGFKNMEDLERHNSGENDDASQDEEDSDDEDY